MTTEQNAALAKAIAELPKKTKEQTAWDQLCGKGKQFHGTPRQKFRDLWLAKVGDAARVKRETKATAKAAATAKEEPQQG